MKSTMDDMALGMNLQVPLPMTPPPSTVIPAKPQIFYDRDNFVKELVTCVLAYPPPRPGILGPGGLGKTSVALVNCR